MTSRNYQSIRTNYWDTVNSRKSPLTSDEILVELYLITCSQCGPSGAFITNMAAIAQYTGLTSHEGDAIQDLWGNDRIEVILRSLVGKGRIKIYPGGWVWVIGKWEFESKNPNVQKALFIELESVPITLLKEFIKLYEDTLSVTLSDTLSHRLCHTHPQTKVALDQSINRLKVITKASKPVVYDASIIEFCKEIVPLKCSTKAQLNIQCKALRSLLSDVKKFYPNGRVDTLAWQEEVFAVLRWARKDNIPGSSGFCWSTVFQSIPPLRKNGLEKFINMRAAFMKSRPGYKYRTRQKDGIKMDAKRRRETEELLKTIEGDIKNDNAQRHG